MERKTRAPSGSFSRVDTGRRIDTYLRYHNKMSTREASRVSGIPFTTMRQYRAGNLRPSLESMRKLERLGLSARYVFGKEIPDDGTGNWFVDEEFIVDYMSQPEGIREKIRKSAELISGGEKADED